MQRQLDFVDALAHARKHDFARVATRGEHALELAARDDVEAAAQPREQSENRQVRVSLGGVADQVRLWAERAIEGFEAAFEVGAGVHEAGRTELSRERCQRDVFDVQRPGTIAEER